MPRLEKLTQQLKNDPDVLFLSMNIDDDPGLIDPFVKQQKLTFTVLPAYSYATDTLKVEGIPQNWIVADGVVRLKVTGYDATPNWEESMKSAIDRFRVHGVEGGTAAAKSPTSSAQTPPGDPQEFPNQN